MEMSASPPTDLALRAREFSDTYLRNHLAEWAERDGPWDGCWVCAEAKRRGITP
jgi:hypothetical protein